jgi:hypothetical protein
MAYKVRCSHCGKSMLLPEGDAGLPVVCLACGTKFLAPDAEGSPVSLPPPPPPEDTSSTFQVAPDVQTKNPIERLVVLPRPHSPEPLRVPWALVAIAATLLLIVGGLGWKAYQWNTVRSGTRELTQLLTDARKLSASGDVKNAYQKYRDVERRAIQFGHDHEEIRKLADEGRLEQERIFAAALTRQPPPAQSRPDTSSPPAPTTAAVAIDPPATTEPVADDGAPAPSIAGTAPTTTAATTQLAELPASQPTTRPTSRRVVLRPPLRPIPEPPGIVTDEEIGRAIQRGVDQMVQAFDPESGQLRHSLRGGQNEAYACGLNALCVYALLQSSQAIPDQRLNVRGPFMKSLITGMKRLPANTGVVTYARGIRATALALYNRSEDRAALRADVQYLLMTHAKGAYSYVGYRESANSPLRGAPSSWDNSNSQYGLLGVWSGAEVGVEVPGHFWMDVLKHWYTYQQADGMWGYTSGGGTLSMTAAGTASLFVAEDYAYSARFGSRVGREPFSDSLKRALTWWEKEDNVSTPPSAWWGYTLYGIERVGLASGFKYFGKHDWYRELAAHVISRQQPDGTWGDLVESAYALLFLSRGRHPVLMNKLRFDKGGTEGQAQGFWGNRPRDAANLARYAGRKLERPLNWQVVTLEREWHDWLDSPILTIGSHSVPYFTAADIAKFRQYVEAGGMIYLQADADSPVFDEFAKDFTQRVLPQYEMIDVPPDHLIYNVLFKSDPPPPLKMVTNGSRILILYSPKDIARAWQLRDEKSKGNVFQLGVNLFIYAAGKRELRNRLSSPYVPPLPTLPPSGTIDIARVRYGGAWDPEPGAWRRFANWFARQTGTGLAVSTTPLKELASNKARFAHLTGWAPYVPTVDEVNGMREYVDAGGVLFIDACGASRPFSDTIRAALAQAFPDKTLEKLPREHPLFEAGAPGMDDLVKPRLRLFAIETGEAANASIEVIRSGKGAVIISNLDVISGLLGTETWGIAGFDPAYCQALVKNLIFWTQDGKPGL